MNNKIPYATIISAIAGDVTAMNYILKHFEGYMLKLSQRTLFDVKGNSYMCVDPEIKRRLETKLMLSVLKFEVNSV